MHSPSALTSNLISSPTWHKSCNLERDTPEKKSSMSVIALATLYGIDTSSEMY